MRHPILIKGETRSPIRDNFQQKPASPSRSICGDLPSRGCESKNKNRVVNISELHKRNSLQPCWTYLATIKDGRSQFSKVTACANGEQEHHEETRKIKERAHRVGHSKLQGLFECQLANKGELSNVSQKQ
jgi:hypothetical protein